MAAATLAWVCSGRLRVTDPSYDRITSEKFISLAGAGDVTTLAGTVVAEAGVWKANILTDREGAVARLVAWSEKARAPGEPEEVEDAEEWETAEFCAAVDSGSCGIFDDAAYPEGDTDAGPSPSFYQRACDAGRAGFGLVRAAEGTPMGVVCQTNGDGIYLIGLRHRDRDPAAEDAGEPVGE